MMLQSDILAAAKASLMLLIVIAANNSFRMVSLDIRAAFLQTKALDKDVFIKPPKNIKKPGFA